MTSAELAALELASLDKAIRQEEARLARMLKKRQEFVAWKPPTNLKRVGGVLKLVITDPFAEAGGSRGSRYERFFDLASVAAQELGEDVLVVWADRAWGKDTKVLARPGQSPEELREAFGTALGEFISKGQ